jgi:DNA-directed RNA polymerase specialized sigma24 family protein
MGGRSFFVLWPAAREPKAYRVAAAQPDIRRYAARNCRAADIDDAVQETLLRD